MVNLSQNFTCIKYWDQLDILSFLYFLHMMINDFDKDFNLCHFFDEKVIGH